MPPVAVALAAHAQLAALRDTWVAPFVAPSARLAREVGRLRGGRAGAEAAQRRTDELVAEPRRRADVAEADADALRLRLTAGSAPPVVVVATGDATAAPDTFATTAAAHSPVQGCGWRLRRVWRGVAGHVSGVAGAGERAAA